MKCKSIVRPEIPERYDAGSDEFGYVKIDAKPFVEYVNDAVINAQADERGQQKFGKLRGDSGVLTVERPYPVEEIIAHHGAQEAGTIGDVFIEPQLLLAQPGDAKIYPDA